MTFPCTSCGACCARVMGRAKVLFDEWGWVRPDGSCQNYDHKTKLCQIYHNRPTVCQVDALKPSDMRQKDWYDQVEEYCDVSHKLVFGTPRERMMGDKIERVLDGMKLVIAVPSYGPVDPACQKDLRVGMMVAAKYGVSWEGDASPDRMGFSGARNTIAQAVLDTPDIDGVMWVDSDIRQQPRDMASLLASAKQGGYDFVTGVYHQREPYHTPVFYHFNKSKNLFQPFEDYPENVIAPIDGCGFGYVYTSKSLLERVASSKSFNEKKGWFPDERDSGGFGEDLSFCYAVMQLGDVELQVNTAIQLGHTANPKVIYREDFLKARAESRAIKQVSEGEAKEKGWGR